MGGQAAASPRAAVALAVAVACLARSAHAMSVVSRAIRHPAGKITLFPEIRVDSSKPLGEGGEMDSNALWQLVAATAAPTTDGAAELSKAMRESCKASCVIVSEDLDMLKTVVAEQKTSMGEFPGPCPVVFYPFPADDAAGDIDFAAVHEAGAAAVIAPVSTSDQLATMLAAAQSADLELVPELRSSDPNEVKGLLDAAVAQLPHKSAVLVQQDVLGLVEGDVLLGKASSLSLLASVAVAPGKGDLVPTVRELQRIKFHGAFLRTTCLPKKLRLDLAKQVPYWEGAVAAIRSTRSTTFSIRTKTESVPPELQAWIDYADIAEEYTGASWDAEQAGAGDFGISSGVGENPNDDEFDPERGDWVGF